MLINGSIGYWSQESDDFYLIITIVGAVFFMMSIVFFRK